MDRRAKALGPEVTRDKDNDPRYHRRANRRPCVDSQCSLDLADQGELTMITRHTLTLYVDVPDPIDAEPYEPYKAREMERLVLAALRRFEYDTDVEQMSVERIEE